MKLCNVLQQCTYIHTSTEPLHAEGAFTVLPPFSVQPVSHIRYTAWTAREKRARCVKTLPVLPALRSSKTLQVLEE